MGGYRPKISTAIEKKNLMQETPAENHQHVECLQKDLLECFWLRGFFIRFAHREGLL